MNFIVYRQIDSLIVQAFNTQNPPTVIPEGCVIQEISSELPDLTKNEAYFNIETKEISLSALKTYTFDQDFVSALQIKIEDIWATIDIKQKMLDAYKYDIEQSILFDMERNDLEDKKSKCRELVLEIKALKMKVLELTDEMNSSF